VLSIFWGWVDGVGPDRLDLVGAGSSALPGRLHDVRTPLSPSCSRTEQARRADAAPDA